MTAKTEQTGLGLLRKPFPPNQISKLPKPYKKDSPKGNCSECGGYHGLPAAHLDYVGHAALTDRLLDADPAWQWEPLAFDAGLPAFDRSGGLWIKLTVCGVTRLGYGHAAAKSYGDPGMREKEVIGDALRNAAMRFGAALDLWHKGDLHLDADEGDAGGQSNGAQSAPGGASVADDPPQEKTGWREPDSALSTPTKLHGELTRLERELAGCGDSEMVYSLTATAEWKEFVRIAERHSPHYLRGGDPAPPEFRGLLNIAADMVQQFDAAEANHIADVARA